LRLGVDFVGGGSAVVDLEPWVGSVRPLQPLRDPSLFATARVAYGGAGVAWGEVAGDEGEGAVDMDGEQLWRLAGEQAGRLMPAGEFRAWRARHGLSRAEAADVLGVSRRTLAAYEDGVQPVPRTVMLARRGWDAVAAEAA
jgi:DNA-binding XRE family transcriptional regulator